MSTAFCVALFPAVAFVTFPIPAAPANDNDHGPASAARPLVRCSGSISCSCSECAAIDWAGEELAGRPDW